MNFFPNFIFIFTFNASVRSVPFGTKDVFQVLFMRSGFLNRRSFAKSMALCIAERSHFAEYP